MSDDTLFKHPAVKVLALVGAVFSLLFGAGALVALGYAFVTDPAMYTATQAALMQDSWQIVQVVLMGIGFFVYGAGFLLGYVSGRKLLVVYSICFLMLVIFINLLVAISSHLLPA